MIEMRADGIKKKNRNNFLGKSFKSENIPKRLCIIKVR